MAVIQAGRHLARVVSHALGQSGTGTRHIAVLFENEAGDRITWFGYLSDGALDRTIKSLKILGWDPVAFDGRIDSLNGTNELVGAEAEIVVEEEEYQGEWRPKVKWVNEVGGGAPDAMPPDEAAAFAAQLRARILAGNGPAPSARPGPARSAQPAPSRQPPRQPPRNDLQRKAAQLPAEARRGLPGAPQEPDFSDDFDLDDIPF